MSALPVRPSRTTTGAGAASVNTAEDYALVRVAVELDPQEAEALRAALSSVFQRPLELEIETRPDILGGVWVRVGDTVIDGSLRGRLETLRHHLRSQCSSIPAASTLTAEPERANP
jgi:hypothetical protein